MKTIRMKGVVRLANSLRRELSQPVTPLRRDELRSIATNAIQQIQEIVAANASSVQALAARSLRAYEFIRSLNFDAVTLAPAGTTDEQVDGSIRFDGLKGNLERRLDILGSGATGQVDALYQWIVSTSRKVEKAIDSEGINPKLLTAATRNARAWTGFFNDRENFDAYARAVARASDCIASRIGASGRMRPPVTVHFRPTRSLYRARGTRDGTRIVLPTPMFTLSAELFAALANAIFNGSSKQEIMQAVAGDEYQTIQAELEALAGVVEITRGVHRDLAESFERVNQAYFDCAIPS